MLVLFRKPINGRHRSEPRSLYRSVAIQVGHSLDEHTPHLGPGGECASHYLLELLAINRVGAGAVWTGGGDASPRVSPECEALAAQQRW